MATFQGRRVSGQWRTVLLAAQRGGVRFRLNSGQRTFAEQQRLYDAYRRGQGPLAAYPSHSAPHIRTGRPDHALDVDMYVGQGVQGFARWLRRRGARVAWTVPGEGWHIETAPGDLARLARRLARPPFRVLRKGSTGPRVRWVQRRLRRHGYKRVPGPGQDGHGYFGRATKRAVRRYQRRRGLGVDGVVGRLTWRALGR